MSQTVREMFDGIAFRYDLTNRVLSMGTDVGWRRQVIRGLKLSRPARVLDLATGTGDLALGLARALGAGSRVVGCDFSMPMLAQARDKARAAGAEQCAWCQGDAMALPMTDDAFDGATISFGIRNVDDPLGALRELRRVLRPGGVLGVLEFGQPSGRLFGAVFSWYSRVMIPRIGGWLTGAREAYEYLPRTSAAFPCGEAFLALMARAGFGELTMRRFSLGIAWCYRGVA